jgi:cell division septation protein DedD
MLPAADRQRALALATASPKRTPPPKAKPAKPVRVAQAPVPSPKPAPAKARPARQAQSVPVSGHWRIQLGAFSQRSGAEALYQRVSGKAALSGRTPYYVAAGPVTRLQVGPFPSKAAAASACSAIGTACFPVPAG